MNFNSIILKTALITLCISHGPMKAMERTNKRKPSIQAVMLDAMKIIDPNNKTKIRHTIEQHLPPQFIPHFHNPFTHDELKEIISQAYRMSADELAKLKEAADQNHSYNFKHHSVWVISELLKHYHALMLEAEAQEQEGKWFTGPIVGPTLAELGETGGEVRIPYRSDTTTGIDFFTAQAVSTVPTTFTVGSTSHSARAEERSRKKERKRDKRKKTYIAL